MYVCMYVRMYVWVNVCMCVCMYVRPFNNWAVPAGLCTSGCHHMGRSASPPWSCCAHQRMQRVTDAMLLRAAVGRLCEACCRCCVAAASAVGCPIDTDAGIAGPAKPQSANALLCCLPRGDGDHHGSCSLRSLPLRALQLACLQYYVSMYVCI